MAAPTVSIGFVARMAARELRSSWRRLAFFFVCIAVGVAAIVALRSVIQSVRATLAGQARSMLAADLLVGSNSPLPQALVDRVTAEQQGGRVQRVSEVTELLTMARTADPAVPATRMVELKAVDALFPLYGAMALEDGPYEHRRMAGGGALVRPELLTQLGVRVGDRIVLGDATFVIRGVVTFEPGRTVGAFSVGPRVFIDRADLPATGLITFGARASYELLLQVPEPALDDFADELRTAFVEQFVRVRTFHRTDDQMEQTFTRAENYLSLVGLVILILGGIGVSSVTQVFVRERLKAVAVLKCLGASGADVLAIYLAQTVLLALAGAACGVAIAGLAIALMPEVVTGIPGLPNIRYAMTLPAVAHGVIAGVVVSVAFALVPLLDVRAVKPALLLRADTATTQSVRTRVVVMGLVGLLLMGVAVWQAGSLRVAVILAAGLAGLAIALMGAGRLLVRLMTPLTRARTFAVRHAALHVVRPGHQTDVILLAVGLGAFFILGIRALETNLVRDFTLQLGEDAPDVFLLDVQQDQRDRVMRLIDDGNGAFPGALMMPVLRARVTGVRGAEVQLDGVQDVRGRGSLAREYTVTYRDHMEANEELVEGRWWSPPVPGDLPEVSIEQEVRDRYDIHVGDEMRFDVLGRVVRARVASIRRVDFREFRSGGFVFVFRPDTFAGAPHSYMGTARGPVDAASRGRLIASVVRDSPNVTIVDLREVLQTFRGIAGAVTRGVTAVGGLVLVSGLLILVGAVSATKFRRIYEVAILRTLGAGSGVIAAVLCLEYGMLGAIAGGMGAAGSMALSWAVATEVLELPWDPAAGLVLTGILAATLLVAVVGVVASADVLRRKPLATLRSE
ncbi:MAG: ABC transporter permease [Vicinamibacterales bacterium]